MNESEVLESAIGHARQGRWLDAAAILRRSSSPLVQEMAANCERLQGVGDENMRNMQLQFLEEMLDFVRTFSGGTH